MSRKTKSSKGLLLAAVVGLVAFAPMHALAANKLIVNGTDGVTPKFAVTDTGYIGVEQGAPTSAIHVIGPGSARDAQIMLQHNPPTDTASGGGGILLYFNYNNQLPSSGDRLGYIYFGSYDGSTQRNPAGLRAIADGTWVSGTSAPSAFIMETTPSGSLTRTERLRINNAGYVGIGTNAPTSILQVVGLPVYANNAAALAGGLTVGAFYRTGADPDVVCVVH